MTRKEKKMLKRQQKFEKKREKLMNASKFTLWRHSRPFWGATLTLLAGLMILYIPIHLFAIAFTPGSYAILGILFGGLITLCGILAYFYNIVVCVVCHGSFRRISYWYTDRNRRRCDVHWLAR